MATFLSHPLEIGAKLPRDADAADGVTCNRNSGDGAFPPHRIRQEWGAIEKKEHRKNLELYFGKQVDYSAYMSCLSKTSKRRPSGKVSVIVIDLELKRLIF
jgi:hypothetical protein